MTSTTRLSGVSMHSPEVSFMSRTSRPILLFIIPAAALLLGRATAWGFGWTVAGGTVTVLSGAQIGTVSDVSLAQGGLVANTGSRIYLGGNWINTGGIFTTGTSTVTFNATTPAHLIASNANPFSHMIFNGVGGYWTMLDAMTVQGHLTLTNGTLDTKSTGNFPISVGGDWNHSGGTFVANASTVTLTGAKTAQLLGSTTFYSLYSTVAGKTLTLQANSTQTVTNALVLTGAAG